ncbi:MAG: DMT family transporter [Pseudomonadota bacterium]
MTGSRHPQFHLICLGIVLAAGAWGLYWIPQRALESAGMTGGWGTIAQFSGCVIILAPVAIWRWRKCQQTGLDLPLIGLCMGGGIVCYANSFLLTDVIRALILFYMLPVWATLIEVVFIGKRPGWRRVISLPMSVAGVWIVIGQDVGLPFPQNAGDWIALLGGAMFAAGAARTEVSQIEGMFPTMFSFFFYGTIFAGLQSWFLASELGPLPALEIWIALSPWFLLICVGFFIPTMIIVAWAPERIGTGLMSILFLSELLFGTASAALWAGEPFGWREVIGSSLLLLAGIIEVALTPNEKQ